MHPFHTLAGLLSHGELRDKNWELKVTEAQSFFDLLLIHASEITQRFNLVAMYEKCILSLDFLSHDMENVIFQIAAQSFLVLDCLLQIKKLFSLK